MLSSIIFTNNNRCSYFLRAGNMHMLVYRKINTLSLYLKKKASVFVESERRFRLSDFQTNNCRLEEKWGLFVRHYFQLWQLAH